MGLGVLLAIGLGVLLAIGLGVLLLKVFYFLLEVLGVLSVMFVGLFLFPILLSAFI